MAANYKEETIDGIVWQRCNSLKIENPLNSAKMVNFSEEKVIKIGDSTIIQPYTSCSKIFNSEETFELLDPVTGAPTGASMSHMELYQALYSLYIKTAMDRDAGITDIPTTYPSGIINNP